MKMLPRLAQALFLVALTLAVLAPVAPVNMPVPGRDEGVFLYTGQQILDGNIPYRDVWDHKGPLIYYLNALGLLLDGSAWGVWWVEVFFLLGSLALGYFSLRKLFGESAALAGSALWLSALSIVLDGGNTIEEFSLLFEFAALAFFLRSLTEPRHTWNEFAIGVCAALAFSLRPNNIGYYLAIGLVTLLSAFFSPAGSRQRHGWALTSMMAGGLLVLAGILAYFASKQALPELYDNLFVYNSYYSQQSLGRRPLEKIIASLLYGFQRLQPYTWIGLLGLAGLLLRLNKRDATARLGWVLLLAVPLQLALSVLSGRQYLHYYTAWVSSLAFWGGGAFFMLETLAHKTGKPALAPALLTILAVATATPALAQNLPVLARLVSADKPDYAATQAGPYLDYIQTQIGQDKTILIFGNQATLYFLSGRKAPGRFVYTYALGMREYLSQPLADEFLNDIIREKPIIIDATPSDQTTPGINSVGWKGHPLARNIVKYIEQNYQRITKIGPAGWAVWKPK